ncbi:MAG: tetratricopeptide repeat protein [Thermodesulfovibrionales bacterium]|jgi:predicted Zn-dependent protease
MGKLSVFIFLLFLTALGFFALENKDSVLIKMPFGGMYEISKVALMLLSTTLGALATLLVFFVRDTKQMIESLQYQRRQKREEKLHGFYAKALNAIISNRDEEAQAALMEIMKETPDHIDALLRLGDIALKRREFKAALDHYKKVRDFDPANLQAIFSMATVMEKMGRYDDSLKYLDEVLDSDSGNNTALMRKRTLLEKKEEWDGLLSLQKTVIKLADGDGEKEREEKRLTGYKYEYARAALETGELEKAEKGFRALLKADEGFIPACLGLVEVLVGKGETEEAINLLEKTYEQKGSVIILARLEDLLISVGEPGRLIRTYKNALSRNPQDNELPFLLGKLYYRLEMVDDAIEALDSVEPLSPTPELSCLRGDLYMKRNQPARAMAEFRRACSIGRPPVSYCCTVCGQKTGEWSGRCPQCGDWNSYELDIHGNCKA